MKGAFRSDPLTQISLKFGSRIGQAAHFSEKTGASILEALDLDRQICLLKQQCR